MFLWASTVFFLAQTQALTWRELIRAAMWECFKIKEQRKGNTQSLTRSKIDVQVSPLAQITPDSDPQSLQHVSINISVPQSSRQNTSESHFQFIPLHLLMVPVTISDSSHILQRTSLKCRPPPFLFPETSSERRRGKINRGSRFQ